MNRQWPVVPALVVMILGQAQGTAAAADPFHAGTTCGYAIYFSPLAVNLTTRYELALWGGPFAVPLGSDLRLTCTVVSGVSTHAGADSLPAGACRRSATSTAFSGNLAVVGPMQGSGFERCGDGRIYVCTEITFQLAGQSETRYYDGENNEFGSDANVPCTATNNDADGFGAVRLQMPDVSRTTVEIGPGTW